MFDDVKEFFRYNRNERYGSYAILLIIALVILFHKYSHHFIKPDPPDQAVMQALIDSITVWQARDSVRYASYHSKEQNYSPPEIEISPFKFNPNTLSDSGYKALGFTENHIRTLRNYMSKGGEFKIKKDFSRLYFVTDTMYSQLESYILLPDKYAQNFSRSRDRYEAWNNKVAWSDTANFEDFKYEKKTADLNWSDTSELKVVRGLGSYFARKIVEHREALGGYYSLGQLQEIYLMTPGKIDTVAPYLTMDPAGLRKININKVSTQELSRHPYLTFKEANEIVLYRSRNGPFESWKELEDANLVNGERSRKIAPYLIYTK